MVRIRIKINVHDGTSQKGKLIDCISEVEAVVFKIIEGREAFFLLTDTANMEKRLKEEARQKFADHGLEVQFPPEYEAGKTVMLRNVDTFISSMSEGGDAESAQEIKR